MSTISKRKRTNTNTNSESLSNESNDANQLGKIEPLLPPRPPVEGRDYVNVKRVADYWVHFRDYIENGKRKAECIYCENKTYAADGIKNGSKNIRNHWEVCPANPNAPINNSKGKQTELIFDKMANEGEGKLTTWTLDLNEVREAVVYMIIIDELPFRFVEKPGFRRLMFVTCPFNIPSRITIARDVYNLYQSEKKKLIELFQKSSQRISFTTDTWTSIQKINYMCLTAHFVDNDWVLHKKIIVFCPIYSHKGKDIAASLHECFKAWKLEDKIFTITVDNASSNDTACVELKKLLQRTHKLIGRGNYMHVRCVAHIINLIVWDGLKRNKRSINKVRYAVKFAKSSPARLKFFKEVASKYTQCELSLSLDCPTRWNSTYTMLETALKYKDAFGDIDIPINPQGDELDNDVEYFDEYGNLIEKEIENSGAPSDYDWLIVEALVVFLKEFKVLTDQVSGSLYVTSNSSIFFIARVLEQLKKWSTSKNLDFKAMSDIMQEKFDKYWGDLDKMNVLMYMGAILDPKVKLVGLKFAFSRVYKAPKDEELKEQVYTKANDLFDEYRRLYTTPTPQNDNTTNNTTSNEGQDDYMDFKKSIEMQVRKGRTDGGYSKSEFDRYLNEVHSEHELDCDVLTWWKLNGHRYPILARLARDVLGVPISTVASESTFSAGRRHLTPFRSSLTPKLVEALLCAQDWIRPRKDTGLEMEEKLEELEILEKELDNTNTTIVEENRVNVD